MLYKIFDFKGKQNNSIFLELNKFLNSQGYIYSEDDFEYLFVIGGDGSFIHFAKEYAFKSKKIIGIKSGNLTFIPDFSIPELNLNSLEFVDIELLQLEISGNNYYAFNDIYISGSLFLEAEIYINNFFLDLFKGSGLLLATQKGSTGKNKSLGGPILAPESNLWLINEIGANNTNKNRSLDCPIVLKEEDYIEIRIPKSENYRIYIDGRDINISSELTLKVKLIKGNSKVVKSAWNTYANKLSDTFLNHHG
ncbi:NAD(+)/NADH kinase [Candidatus Mycoplasma haematohominis]|uniref:NAD(+)/NADH kinase n=1 Tax=Candidatus Mycoplasma haematohominis TaxID=1494318 RepID=UPI001C0A77EA|nr:NAD(+)/NADH kinase [Candidatus Mycoplasma haemohominis]